MEFPYQDAFGFQWRRMSMDDAAGLAKLAEESAALDGATELLDEAAWRQRLQDADYAAVNSVLVLDPEDCIAAAGWIQYQDEAHEVQAFLDGRVHPTWRGNGLGSRLLETLETLGLEQLTRKAEGRRRVLRILFYDRGEDAIALFRAAGYHFQFAETEFRRDLTSALPVDDLPDAFSVQTWAPGNAPRFYQAYREAFASRGGELRTSQVWMRHFTHEGDDEFCPGESILVLAGDEPAGYLIVHRYDREDGQEGKEFWVAQLGVVPQHRRKGIATAMLTRVMRRLLHRGAHELTLTVNVDNPGARQVYEQIGFKETRTMTLYRKEVDAGPVS